MSESGESIDQEVEVRMPELVSFEDGGQGDVYHDCQKYSWSLLAILKEEMKTTMFHRRAPSVVFPDKQK